MHNINIVISSSNDADLNSILISYGLSRYVDSSWTQYNFISVSFTLFLFTIVTLVTNHNLCGIKVKSVSYSHNTSVSIHSLCRSCDVEVARSLSIALWDCEPNNIQ